MLTAGLFAASRLSWQWSMVAEVFTLNNLFVGLLFFLTASFHCTEETAERKKVKQENKFLTQESFQRFFIYVLFFLLDFVRLPTGERSALAWGCVTSTP